jgi:protein N-terminal amidase
MIGTGFACFPNLASPLSTLSLGICMDLNPAPEHADWPAPCELASFALANRSRVLVIICAWLQSEGDPNSPWCLTTINYWLARLLPLWNKDSPDLIPIDDYPAPEDHDETIVVLCNRTGLERGTPLIASIDCQAPYHPEYVGSQFAGCSMVIKCSRKWGKWDVVGLVNKSFEGLLSLTVE